MVWGKSELMFYTVGESIRGLNARDSVHEVTLVQMLEDCCNTGWKSAVIK